MVPTDAQLMARIQAGDQGAFETFCSRHQQTLHLHLLRYMGPQDAEDLEQEVLVRLWGRARQFEGRGSPLAWMLRIATNLALNHIRDRRGKASIPLPADLDDGETEFDAAAVELASCPASATVEARDDASRLIHLIAELPPERQSVVRMARIEGMQLRQIAAKLDLPVGTVKSRLHLATQWLEDRWEEDP